MKKKILLFVLIATVSISCAQHKKVVLAPAAEKNDSEIKFRFAESELLPKYLHVLDDDIAYLKNNPTEAIVIEGHTDVLGEGEYNLDLGDKRAKAVKAYFIENGIEASRIVTITYGEDQPLDGGHNSHEDRRVRIRDMNQ